jgi:hypothetical protein
MLLLSYFNLLICTKWLREKSSSESFLILILSDVSARILGLTFLNKRKADTLVLGEGDKGILTGTDHENVGKTGGERVTTGILNVSDLVGTGMVLNVLEDTDTTDIVTAGNENVGTVLLLDNRLDFVGLKVELDGIVDLDIGVGVADSAAVVGNDVGDLVGTNTLLGDLAQFKCGFFGINSVGLETALDVVKDAVVLAGLPDGDDITETERVSVVTSLLTVNFDVGRLVLKNLDALLAGESVLKTVLQKN